MKGMVQLFVGIGVVQVLVVAGAIFFFRGNVFGDNQSKDPTTLVWVKLDDYKIMNYLDKKMPLRVDLRLMAKVDSEKADGYQKEKKGILLDHQHRLLETIAMNLRTAPYETLYEPDLNTIKGQLKIAVIEVLGPENVYDISIPSYNVQEAF